jgi:hypothetical protein
MQQAAQLFGVELFTQRRRPHQITEHHRELAAFANRNRLFTERSRSSGHRFDHRVDSVGGPLLAQLGDCRQQLTPMADGGNAEFPEIFSGEKAQYFGADAILAECRFVTFQT